MSAKPLIGLNGDYRPAKKDAIALSWFNTGYYDSLTAAKAIPMLISPLADDADLRRMLELVDGVMLAGCSLDLDPIRMGVDRHPATRPMPSRREDFDRRLCKMAVDMKLPILAIGGGMQLLNVICGGSLHQHLPEDCPRALHHYDNVEGMSRHVLNIVPGTKVDEIYGPGEIRVNSNHHQALNFVPPLFRVTATTPDGVIEAIEAVDPDWYCMGVQWHPENESASALDMQVFEHFIAGCSQSEELPVILPMRKAA